MSWDVHISKLLSIALVVGLCCRGGDAALSRGRALEFLAFRHIELKLIEGGSSLKI